MTDPSNYLLSRNKEFCNFCPGYCCYSLEGSSLLVNGEDINRIARFFKISDGEVRKRYIQGRNTFIVRQDGSCIFLDNGKMCKRCSIHTARPRQCGAFPYDKPCPYLESKELLEILQWRVEQSMLDLPERETNNP